MQIKLREEILLSKLCCEIPGVTIDRKFHLHVYNVGTEMLVKTWMHQKNRISLAHHGKIFLYQTPLSLVVVPVGIG